MSHLTCSSLLDSEKTKIALADPTRFISVCVPLLFSQSSHLSYVKCTSFSHGTCHSHDNLVPSRSSLFLSRTRKIGPWEQSCHDHKHKSMTSQIGISREEWFSRVVLWEVQEVLLIWRILVPRAALPMALLTGEAWARGGGGAQASTAEKANPWDISWDIYSTSWQNIQNESKESYHKWFLFLQGFKTFIITNLNMTNSASRFVCLGRHSTGRVAY